MSVSVLLFGWCLDLDQQQPLLLLTVALQETVLGPLEALPGVIQAGQSLQSSVAPHDVQLQHSKVVHRAEQPGATFTGNHPSHSGQNKSSRTEQLQHVQPGS